MELSAIDARGASALDRIPEACGKVTVGCSDVAGIVQGVIDSFGHLRSEYVELQGTVRALDEDQSKVLEASDEARLLSERAIERLNDGTTLISSSLNEIGNLLSLVETLTEHVTGFAAAMDQVRRSSQEIDQIAETTNILALNATIEAASAGDAGKGFAVVAQEVKQLAAQAARATREIEDLLSGISKGTGEAENSFGKLSGAIAELARSAMTVRSDVDNQRAATSSIEQTMGDTAAGTEQMAHNSAVLANRASTTQKLSGDARQNVKALLETIHSLERSAGDFVASIKAA